MALLKKGVTENQIVERKAAEILTGQQRVRNVGARASTLRLT
ncbi:hypothetical protein LTSEJOH_4656 [Salmonella enterica subsp. enterica serovar Johannesburg str. S5-703]|nr:hypothetical protein LTSEJOH_4656 [Salmonella enterica subsp. enterica serovar Johannesburg str. S5-703]